MTLHPWMRLPEVAKMFGLMLGALGLIVASLSIESITLKYTFLIAGLFGIVIFGILSVAYLALFIRDYMRLYPKFKRKLFGIPWFKY